MADILKWLEGRKTTGLVLIAVLLILGGGMTPEDAGLDFSTIDMNELLMAVFAGLVGTIKAGITRKS